MKNKKLAISKLEQADALLGEVMRMPGMYEMARVCIMESQLQLDDAAAHIEQRTRKIRGCLECGVVPPGHKIDCKTSNEAAKAFARKRK